LGTIIAPLVILVLSGGKFLFGWAKPVPVNYSALRRPKQHMAWVAAAGPAANLAMAVLWAVLLRIGISLSERSSAWMSVVKQYGVAETVDVVLRHGSSAAEYLIGVGAAGILINVVLMLLNLLPIPPLDGGRIVTSLLPHGAAGQFARIEPWGLPILLLLLFTNVLGLVLAPLFNETEALIRAFVLL
jgi:Zn-dependent protease